MILPAAALAAEETGEERGALQYEEVISPQYTGAGPFSEGLAAVEKNGKWGYIDENNKTVISFRYDIAGVFREGLAVVGKLKSSKAEEKYNAETGKTTKTGRTLSTYTLSIVDASGKETALLYDRYYDEAKKAYTTGPVTYTTTEDVLSTQVAFHSGYLMLEDPSGSGTLLFGTDGKTVSLSQSPDTWIYPLGWPVTENLVAVAVQTGNSVSQRYYNLATGALLQVDAPAAADTFTELRPFNQGMAMAGLFTWDRTAEAYVGTWGVIGTDGKFLIQPAYRDFRVSDIYGTYEVFGETGLAMVQNTGGKWGAIDKTGAVVIPFQYDHLYAYSFGLAAFQQGNRWGFLDGAGNVAIAAQYVQTTGFGDRGYAVVDDGKTVCLIDSSGAVIPGSEALDPETYFQEAADGSTVVYAPDEYVVIKEGNRYGYGRILYQPALPDAGETSAWAYEEVTAAIQADLVPIHLQNLYKNDITREEFSDLTIQAVSRILGKDIEDVVKTATGKTLTAWRQEYPFYDSASANVIAAYALGIVNGRGDGKFDPYAPITRQEAAAFLTRAAKVLGMDTTQAPASDFKDAADISESFRTYVDYVCAIGVMNGTEGGNFTPRGSYTRQQSYVTIYRLYQAAEKK